MILKGQLALVTGAAQGIGAAISQALAAQGAKVVMADIDADLAKRAAAGLSGKGLDCIGEELDVTRREAVDAFADRITNEIGPISILINNAGIGLMRLSMTQRRPRSGTTRSPSISPVCSTYHVHSCRR